MFGDQVYSLSPVAAWLAFGASLVAILLTGARLSRYGDIIGHRTGLGGAWIGLVLMASVTSLPELVTGLSAVLVVGEPDLAVGSTLGSLVYNLLIIAVLDFIYRPGTIYGGIERSHSLSAGFGVVILGVLAGAMFLQRHFTAVSVGHVGPFAIAAPALYLIAMRSLFHFERREGASRREALAMKPGAPSLARVYVLFLVNATVLVAAAIALPAIGEAIALSMGWEETFVGTVFLAVVTSVPEVVISVEAVRIGAVDLAIGGILGSNLFDLMVLAVEDVAYVQGPLLAAASEKHLLTVVAALTMTGIVLTGLCSRPKARVFGVVGWTSLGLLAVGVFSGLVLFLLG
jgi:cation:H+ antiporter